MLYAIMTKACSKGSSPKESWVRVCVDAKACLVELIC